MRLRQLFLRRITVEPIWPACLGAREARPGVVVTNSPDDRAFGFQPGDLRHLSAVFVPGSLAGEE